MDINITKHIEEIHLAETEDIDDAEVYKYLVASHPDGKIMLSDSEQEDFERKMGIGKFR